MEHYYVEVPRELTLLNMCLLIQAVEGLRVPQESVESRRVLKLSAETVTAETVC